MSAPDFDAIPAAIVADVLRVGGMPHQALSSRILRLPPKGGLWGPAFCARGETELGGPPMQAAKTTRYEMFRRIGQGEILVVASGGYDEAVVFGENVVVSLAAKGCAGIVADGGVRDVDAIRAMTIPVYARFATPVSSAGRWRYVALQEAIAMPGQTAATVMVRPGDFMVADGDGVMVVPAEFAADVAADARRLHAIEEGFRPRLEAGEDPEGVYGSVNKFGHVRRHRS